MGRGYWDNAGEGLVTEGSRGLGVLFFGVEFDGVAALGDEFGEVGVHDSGADKSTDGPHGDLVADDVGHACVVRLSLLEVVVVDKTFESAFGHGMLQEGGFFVCGDLDGEVLFDAEVSGTPGDGVAEQERAGGFAGDDAFGCVGDGVGEEVDISGQREAGFGGGGNVGRDGEGVF